MEDIKRPVYIWQAPVRIYHWLNALFIVILFVTGMYIGNPVMAPYGEATSNFVMGTMRYVHGVTAWLFTANILFRAYWAFAGNEYAHFRPWQKGFWPDAWDTLKYYTFAKREHTLHFGHNVLAQLMYFFIMWLGSLLMILTGFAMRAEIKPGGLLDRLFGWVTLLLGNADNVRMLHHLSAWAFITFIIAHVYMVVRQDILDEDGTVTSMISGYKFALADQHERGEE